MPVSPTLARCPFHEECARTAGMWPGDSDIGGRCDQPRAAGIPPGGSREPEAAARGSAGSGPLCPLLGRDGAPLLTCTLGVTKLTFWYF